MRTEPRPQIAKTPEAASSLPKLSVIIACYNNSATIAEQLEALARQQYSGPWEVIVADNGSTDDTRAVVEQFRDQLADLRIVDASARRGAGHARNAGARVATGDALVFTDADDVVGENYLAAMARALSKYSFVACRLELRKLNQPWVALTRGKLQAERLDGIPFIPHLLHAGGSTIGIRRSVFEAVGGFDEGFFRLQDTDLCMRVQLAGTQLQFVSETEVHMRCRETFPLMFRQGATWGETCVVLYKKALGLGVLPARRPWRNGIGHWVILVREMAGVRNRGDLGRFLHTLGFRWGMVRGSIKHRLVAF